MSDIKQTFSIDASQAISALQSLNREYANHLDQINSLASAMKRGGGQMQTAMKAVGTTTTASLNQANNAVNRLTTSAQLMSRILFTQATIRGFRLLTQGAANSARSFVEFEKGLSEIQALDPTTNLDALAKSSQQLSNNLNVKLMDVVAARLDLVGSGFASAAEQSKVFTASTNLAKLGAANQAEATDLLITGLNAYGASADQADRFARVFFAGADKGRFTISELAKNFGKAAPAARAVGIQVEELTSLFSALTVAGVSPAEAATQANAVANAFIKPSKAMQAALKNLNVESGQSLIAQRGLAGAIQAVIGTTDGSATAIGKLFINQRALRPVLTLTSDAFRTFNDHLKNTHDLTQQEFDFRLAQRLNTDAERATRAINQLRNAITVGLGGGLVETAANLDRLTGKTELLSIATEKFFRVISGHGIQDLQSSFTDQASAGINKLEGELATGLNRQAEVGKQALEISKSLGLSTTQAQKLGSTLQGAFQLNKARAFDDQIKNIFTDLEARAGNREVNRDLAAQFDAALIALKELSTQANVTDAELRPILATFQNIESQIGQSGFFAGLGEKAAFGPALEKVNRIFENLLQRRQALGQIPPENLSQVKSAADQLKTASNTWPNDAQKAAEQLLRGAAAVSASLRQAAAVGAQAGAAAGVAKARGGLAYFDRGGFAPRGTDTIPAMLSPGEFVVNARSTRQFFSQLQAINSGIAPVYRAEGGSVTNNVSIGDIVVQGGSSSRQTARSIVSELRREFRRGTSSF